MSAVRHMCLQYDTCVCSTTPLYSIIVVYSTIPVSAVQHMCLQWDTCVYSIKLIYSAAPVLQEGTCVYSTAPVSTVRHLCLPYGTCVCSKAPVSTVRHLCLQYGTSSRVPPEHSPYISVYVINQSAIRAYDYIPCMMSIARSPLCRYSERKVIATFCTKLVLCAVPTKALKVLASISM